MAQLALAATLLGMPLRGSGWAISDPCFPGNAPALGDVGSYASPEFADIDGDGDLDAFVGQSDGATILFRNTGSATEAKFAAPETNPFGLSSVSELASPDLVDIDGDGDIDAFVGELFGGDTIFFRNTGTATTPAFAAAQENPFGLGDVIDNAKPEFADIDGDADLDAFIGDHMGSIIFFRNTGTIAAPAFGAAQSNPFGLVDVDSSSLNESSSPELADIDGDGDLDALIGEELGNTVLFRNTGTMASPAFASPQINAFGFSDVGSDATPELVDIDGDGDLDAFLGNSAGKTSFRRNTGTTTAPAFASLTNPFGLAKYGYRVSPELADIDGDGDLDAFIGNIEGVTKFFWNTGTRSEPAFAAFPNNLGISDVGDLASPKLADIDGDGDLDALIGTYDGATRLFFNTGTAGSPGFALATTTFGISDVGERASPELADIDGDGDRDALIGEGGGPLILFRNTGTASAPGFAAQQVNPFGLHNVNLWATPDLVDADGDGDLDLFVGQKDGSTIFFRNTGSATSPAFAEFQTEPFGLASVPLGFFGTGDASPELADIDGDGDFDAFVGAFSGDTIFSPNDCRSRAELAIDFGPAFGLWVLRNDTSWEKLHALSPEDLLAVDMDGNGVEELVVDFGPSYGIWLRRNDSSWEKLHGLSPEAMAKANLDGNSKDELLIDFGAAGLWIHRNDASWEKLHAVSPEGMVSANLDGQGKDDVVIDFGPPYGVWVRYNEVSWRHLHTASPESMAVADVDGADGDDVVFDFGAHGIWIWRDNASWGNLHGASPELVIGATMDGNFRDELVVDFGSAAGTWVFRNDAAWENLHALSPEILATASMDASDEEEVVIDFGAAYGIWVRRNDKFWKRLHPLSPEQIVPLSLD